MKRLAAILFVLMLGILPATAESASTQPVRGATLHQKAEELLHWIYVGTSYDKAPVPKIRFVDDLEQRYRNILETQGFVDEAGKFARRVSGLYVPPEKTIYLKSDWTGRTRHETELLLHELIHYHQHLARRIYKCTKDWEYWALREASFLMTQNATYGQDVDEIDREYEKVKCIPPTDKHLDYWSAGIR